MLCTSLSSAYCPLPSTPPRSDAVRRPERNARARGPSRAEKGTCARHAAAERNKAACEPKQRLAGSASAALRAPHPLMARARPSKDSQANRGGASAPLFGRRGPAEARRGGPRSCRAPCQPEGKKCPTNECYFRRDFFARAEWGRPPAGRLQLSRCFFFSCTLICFALLGISLLGSSPAPPRRFSGFLPSACLFTSAHRA